MLNKETKQKAEEMAATLAPLFATAQKLGEKLQRASSETRKAHRIATAWQYPTNTNYAEDAGESWEEIQTTKAADFHKWAEILEAKYKTMHEKETAEECARLNYSNYARYICDTFAHLLHEGDTWALFYNKKGLESLADFIEEKCAGACVSIDRDGTSWEAFGSVRFYCYLIIRFYGVNGTRAKSWGTYAEISKGDRREWEKPETPRLFTVAQYVRAVADLKKLENEAKTKAREHHEKARASGLIYFVGGLNDPLLNIWGVND